MNAWPEVIELRAKSLPVAILLSSQPPDSRFIQFGSIEPPTTFSLIGGKNSDE
jgi:hypothetical protein